MLIENTLYGTVDKVQDAISVLQEHEPPEGYYVAFSGGKDSVVVLDLCRRAKVLHDEHYNLTTVDPPELIYFIRKHYPEAWKNKERPKLSMYSLIVKNKYPPTRIQRYCCKTLKEAYGGGRVVVTGIRKEESARRAKREIFERSTIANKTFLHPIINWTSSDIWEYIHRFHIPYCSLYDEGFNRIGCIMCPFHGARQLKRDMERWPRYANLYKQAICKAYDARKAASLRCDWGSGEEMFQWWIKDLSARHIMDDCRMIPLFSEDDGEGVL